MHILDRFHPEKYTASRVQLFCMAVVSVITALMLALGDRCNPALYQLNILILSAAALLFVGVSLGKPMSRTAKGLFLFGFCFIIWYLVLCFTDLIGITSDSQRGLRYWMMTPALEYLMVLPFASIRNKDTKPWGLYFLGSAFCIGSELLLMLFGLQVLNITPPGFENILMVTSKEMCVSWLANVYATVFTIAIGFKIYFFLTSRKKQLKLLFALAILPDLCAVTLSYSESLLLLSACLIGGAVFFSMVRDVKERKCIKKLLLGAAAAVCVVLVILMGAKSLQKIRSVHLQHVAASQQTVLQQTSPADTQTNDSSAAVADASTQESKLQKKLKKIFSLTGRTTIWKKAIENIKENPKILLFGLPAGDTFRLPLGHRIAAHTHNAWMQTLIQAGLIGLLMACILTWIAFKNCFQLLFSSWANLSQKECAMLVIAIMAAEFLEPYLFFVNYPGNFANLAFLMCLGYVVHWNAEARKAARAN